MKGETKEIEYKITFDSKEPGSKPKLVKDIVSIANCGGGKLIFGRKDAEIQGVTEDVLVQLDGARIQDLLTKYIGGAEISIRPEIEDLQDGKFVLTLNISKAQFPVVMSSDSSFTDKKGRDKSVFRKGDIWTRHNSQNDLANYLDLRNWIEEAKEEARKSLLDRIQTVATLPEGSDIRVVTSTGTPVNTPDGLLEDETIKRDINPNHLIAPYFLYWLYLNREYLRPTREELQLLIASALRRSATLYWWLIDADENPELIVSELNAALVSDDRDKSDANKSIVDLASIYASDSDLEKIMDGLAQSRYAHFKSAARSWQNREQQIQSIIDRIKGSKISGTQLQNLRFTELQSLGDGIAGELMNSPGSHKSRQLSEINMMMWSRRTKRLA